MSGFPNSQSNHGGAIPVYLVPGGPSPTTALNISTPTVVKAAPGSVLMVVVLTAGSSPGSVNDCTTSGAAAQANQVATIPNSVGSIFVDFPCLAGITVVPGTGQVVSAAYL